MNPTTLFQGLGNDLRIGLRRLRKSPGFTAVAVLSLALGLGANAAVFTLVDTLLLRDLPYAEPDRLVRLWETFPYPGGVGVGSVSAPNLADWREQNDVFEEIGGYSQASLNLAQGTSPERVAATLVTPELLPLLGVEPVLGRLPAAEDSAPGAPAVVVIGHGMWHSRFAGEPGVVGSALRIDGAPATVIGVMPPGFQFPPRSDVALWAPLTLTGEEPRGQHWLATLGRLRPGTTLDAADTAMKTIAARLAVGYPEAQEDRGIVLQGLPEATARSLRPILLALWASVGFVLLIGCGNVANLLLARAAARRRELAVRAALGGGRVRLVRQVLVESLLVAAGGAILGVPLGTLILRAVAALPGTTLPPGQPLVLDRRVLFYCLLATGVAALVSGLIPALRSSRPRLQDALGDRGTADGYSFRRDPLRASLVVAEVALALVVLIGAGLLLRSLVELGRVDPGLRTEGVLTARVSLSSVRSGEEVVSLYGQLLERLRGLPGVESVGMINRLPLQSWGHNGNFVIDGRPPEPVARQPFAEFRSVSPDYHATLGIPILSGRGFGPGDGPGSSGVVLVNRTLAERFWPDENPVGQRIAWGRAESEDDWYTVVGVIGDVHNAGLDRESLGEIHHLVSQTPASEMSLVLAAAGDPLALAPAIRRELAALDADATLFDVETMNGVVDRFLSPWRFQGVLIGGFGALALLLALGGVYGVMSYAVTQRTRELGVRMALGARPADVVRLVVRQGLVLAVAGAAAGVAVALALTRLLASQLYGIGAADPLTFAAVTGALVAVSVAACTIPAQRASRVDPAAALQAE